MSTQAGWNADTLRHAIRGADLAVPTVFTAGGRGDLTLLIPVYFDPSTVNNNWEYHLLTAGTADGVTRTFRINMQADGVAAIQYKSGGVNRTATAAGTGSSVGLHHMVAVSYDHTAGDVTIRLYRQGIAAAIATGVSIILPIDDMAITDQLCLGNFNSDGTGNVNIGLDSPILGIICRKDLLGDAALEVIWNGGVTPNFRDLFPANVSDMAWAIQLAQEHHDWTGGALEQYKPWDAAQAGLSRLHSWDERDGTGGSAWASLKAALTDQVSVKSGGANASPSIELASFFDDLADEGGFWQPGQPTHSLGSDPIAGSVEPIYQAVQATRTGSRPVIAASFGNSRCSLMGAGPVSDGSSVLGIQSLAYGFARGESPHFGGTIACNVGININETQNLYDRVEAGAPTLSTGNHARMGFGSVDAANGPGGTYMLADDEVVAVRFNVTDPVGDLIRDAQPVVVLAKRPGAGVATVHTNAHTTDDGSAGTLIGSEYITEPLSTTVASGLLDGAIGDGANEIKVHGGIEPSWVGQLVQFVDDDLAEIESIVGFDGSSTTYGLKHPVNGAKADNSAVNIGPLEYLVIESGDLAAVAAGANAWVGAAVDAVGNVEIVAMGYYYTGLPNTVCPIIMGWGGNGEGDQLNAEFTGAWQKFATAIGADVALLTLATQGVVDLEADLRGRMGPLVNTLPVLGAPEGAYSGASFLADNEFTTATAGSRSFATSNPLAAFIPVFDLAYDFVTAAYAGHLYDGSHPSPDRAAFLGRLLWEAIGDGSLIHVENTDPLTAGPVGGLLADPVISGEEKYMKPKELKFEAIQGDTLRLTIQGAAIDGVPLPAGAAFSFKAKSCDATSPKKLTATPTLSNAGADLEVRVEAANNDTETTYFFDIDMIEGDGTVSTLYYGEIKISPEITLTPASSGA